MLNKPTDQQLRALRNLRMTQDWETVQEWLEDSLNELRQRTDREANEVQMRWNQGAAQILALFLDNVENAVNKLKSRSKQ